MTYRFTHVNPVHPVALVLTLIVLASSLTAFAQEQETVITYIWWGGNPNNFYDTAKKEFEELHPNMRVDLVSGYKDVMVVQSIGGSVDVLLMDSPFFGEFLQQDLLLPLNSILEKDPNAKTDLENDFWPGSYRWAEYDGSLYCLPFIWTQSQVLFYNENMFAKTGLQPPQPRTWEDLLEPMRKLSADENHYGIEFGQWWGGLHHMALFNGAGYFDDPTYPTKATLNDPRTLKAAEFWVNIVTDEKVAGGSFAAGTTGMSWTWWGMKGVWGPLPFEYDLIEAPAGPDAGTTVNYPAAAANLAISATSKHPQAALEWIKFLLSPRMMKLATTGGAGIPTRRSVALDPDWLHADNDNNEAALRPLATAVPQNPFTPAWGEIGQLLEQPVASAFRGEASIVSILQNLNDQVDALIKKYAY